MKKFFNMVEVTLAIAVVALGMASIMVLFPVGFQASRDAVGDNYANNASQLFTSYLKLSAKQSATELTLWNTFYWDDAGNPSPFINLIPAVKPDLLGNTEGNTLDVLPAYYDNLSSGIYKRKDTTGLYRVYQGNTNVKDFTAAVRIWRTPVTCPVCTTGTWAIETFPYSEAVGINIEFTWPVEKPYANRSKRVFYIEFFKSI